MNPAVAALLGSISTGAVTLIVAVFSIAVGRGGRRADIADKVSEVWDRTTKRLDHDLAEIEAKCDKCESRLVITERRLADAEDDAKRAKRALRALIRVIDTNDPVAIAEAIEAARDLT
jgi:hypothetical protein